MARLKFTSNGECGVAPERGVSRVPVPCNPALQRLAQAKQVLLLQGPVGPFFDRLSRWLQAHGAGVRRVVFQPGDARDCRACPAIRFEGSLDEWPDFFEALLARHQVNAVVLFGQSRKHHALAVLRARELGIDTIVLEEGYIRPGYVTMELEGVNGLSRTLDHYTLQPDTPGLAVRAPAPERRDEFWDMAGHACRHYWHQYWGEPVSAQYQHHRSRDIWHHSRYWVRSWIYKHLRLAYDKSRVRSLEGRPYFFVPLQHEGDSQITHHSPYPEIKAFIADVLASFAAHGPAGSQLVFKTHPHARGGPSYTSFIRAMSRRLGIEDRVLHLIEGHTPTLVEQAQAVVLINSTVGFQALARFKPLAILGEAIYKRPGLYFDGPLNAFWTQAGAPDQEHVRHFIGQLIALTLVPCHIYAGANEPLSWRIDPDSQP